MGADVRTGCNGATPVRDKEEESGMQAAPPIIPRDVPGTSATRVQMGGAVFGSALTLVILVFFSLIETIYIQPLDGGESTTALASPMARTAMGRRLADGFPDLVRSRHPGGRPTLRPILDLALSPSGCARSRCHRCAEDVVGDPAVGTSPASSAAALAGEKDTASGR